MDFQTIRRNLKNGKYKKFESFYRDIQLIWDNCKSFNTVGSDIYNIADALERTSRSIVLQNKEDLQIQDKRNKKRDKKYQSKVAEIEESPEQSEATFYEKTQEESVADEIILYGEKMDFIQKVQSLSAENLAKLVREVKDVCSQAFYMTEENLFQIEVDKLNRKCFEAIDSII